MKKTQEKETLVERLSAGRLAAASRKLWSSTAMPEAVSTPLLLAQGLRPYSCCSLVTALMAGAAGTAQIPQGFAARATPRQTFEGVGTAGSPLAAAWQGIWRTMKEEHPLKATRFSCRWSRHSMLNAFTLHEAALAAGKKAGGGWKTWGSSCSA